MKLTDSLDVEVTCRINLPNMFSLQDLVDAGLSVEELTLELISSEGLVGIADLDNMGILDYKLSKRKDI